MGAAASSANIRASLNAQQAASFCGEAYDQAIFDQIKSSEGLVTVEQLFDAQTAGNIETEENKIVLRRQKALDEDCSWSDEDEGLAKGGAEESEDEARDKDQVGDQQRGKLDPKAVEADLETRRNKLDRLLKEGESIKAKMKHAAKQREFEKAAKWKLELEKNVEMFDELEAEIEDIEALAWEPVVKGETVLFYYNWFVPLPLIALTVSHLRPYTSHLCLLILA